MTAIASVIAARGTGRIYIVRGPTLSGTLDLATQSADFQIGGPGFGDVLAAGDVTGDGLSDIVVGVPALNLVHLYAGQASGGILPTNLVTFTLATAADDRVGASIQLSDVDNDSIREILIEALRRRSRQLAAQCGCRLSAVGSPTLTSHNPAMPDVAFYGAAGEQLGSFVSAGNANRDNVEDLLMVSAGAGGGAGDVMLYYGRSEALSGQTPATGSGSSTSRIRPTSTRKSRPRNPAVGIIRSTQVFELTGERRRRDRVDPLGDPGSASPSTVSPKFVLEPGLGHRAVERLHQRRHARPGPVSIVNVTWTASAGEPAVDHDWTDLRHGRSTDAILAEHPGVVGRPAGGDLYGQRYPAIHQQAPR